MIVVAAVLRQVFGAFTALNTRLPKDDLGVSVGDILEQ
jgi:hypothetical protein